MKKFVVFKRISNFFFPALNQRIQDTYPSAPQEKVQAAPKYKKLKMSLQDERGFTIVELVSTVVVTSIFSGLILFFFFNYWRYGLLLEADLDTYVTRLNAGDIIREQISNSSGLIIQNSLPDTNTHFPDPSEASEQYWIPIHAIPGNIPIGADGTYTPVIYFLRPSLNSNGEFIMNDEQPYQDEYVLYLDGTKKQLLLRSLSNPLATDNKLLTSCPPESATASCPAAP